MDRLRSIEVWVKVAELGGFAVAAGQLRMSPTMVGKHIRLLEEHLGARLIQRTTRRQSLTEAGNVYLEQCRRLLADLAEADASVQQLRRTPRGVLRIACPVTFGSERLVPALADYLRAQPEVSVELTLSDQPVDLVDQGYEAAPHIGMLNDSNLISRPLQPYRMVIGASPAYLKARGTPQTPADLAQHNCLGFTYWRRRNRWRMTTGTEETAVRVQGNLTVNNGQALRRAALASLGIVLQPEALLSDDLAQGRLRTVLPAYSPPPRPMNLLYLPDRQLTPKLRSFVDFIFARFGDRGAA